jgi:putative ABC transport system permease protein
LKELIAMTSLWQDIRYAARMLLKNPGISIIVVIALALGIGANSAIFSVVNAVLLRPLPYEDAERLVFLNEKSQVSDEMSIAYPNYLDWRAQTQTFETIGIYNGGSYNLTGAGDPEQVIASQCSADLFKALRVKPLHGRLFTDEEDKPGGRAVVLLSYPLWQRRFGGQTSILNQAITLNGKSYDVIGIMPPSYTYPRRAEVWVSLGQLSDQGGYKERGNHPGLLGIGRLKPGVTLEQAQSEMNTIGANLDKQYPDSNSGTRPRLRPMLDVFVGGDSRRALWVIFGAVAFVLLIACANIANLLLARATARRKEMAIRTAVGASRWRLARQLLTESTLLSLIGGGVGLALARWGVDLILYMSPDAIPRSREVGLDWTVLAFTAGIAVLTGLIFGLLPAIQAGDVDVHETLKESGRGTSSRHWLRSSLVVGEVATTLVLLIAAGLMIRSFYLLQKVNPGFSHEHLTTFSIALPEKEYESVDSTAGFYNRLLDNIRALPGVESVAAASGLPLGNNGWQQSFRIDGRPEPKPEEIPLMETCLVTPDYFKAMNIPVLRGRVFTDSDNRSHLSAQDHEAYIKGATKIVIDEEFAKRYWPNEDPIGQRLVFGSHEQPRKLEIIGVVGRVKMESLIKNTDYVQAYYAYRQLPANNMTVIIKGGSDPNQLIGSARAAIREIDPDQPIFAIRSMDEIRGESVQNERLNLTLLSLFAGIALVLAIVGIYGVMSYSVTQRTHEIGIRMAVGARPRDVFAMIMGHGMKLALIGVGIGLVGAFALTRLMASMLFGVAPTDAMTYGSIAALLIGVALLACYLPGRRATKVEPTISLRYE